MSKHSLTEEEIREGFSKLGLMVKYSEPYTNAAQFSENLVQSIERPKLKSLGANSQCMVEEEGQDA
ncbi:MAG TPA: hypothetical protein ACFYD7_02440 [Candidatus Wujingus californicus]|uniref:hypothetical protein n=1 Tax=Candidatus Wujingus californicus TaxID=3367618 RepID=UPI001E107BAD|nr:hypothetical protein [Planctomycetota bacterium]MDO8131854.1 hypothetical protein [Candidatus Brocadiales bacterium]